jgi:hypothetical protein
MAYLKKLDIGHGYTADGGKTFPFRGKGIGLMPTLTEVLEAFPQARLLINVKSRDPSEGDKLAAVLNKLPAERRAQIMVYGGDEPIEVVRARMPDIRTISRAAIKSCLLGYIGYGWSGVVPKACRNAMVILPINVAPWLWGWPDRFLNRMKAANSEVFVLGPYRGGEFSTGIDTPEQFARLPQNYSGGIWTNEIEAIAPARTQVACSPDGAKRNPGAVDQRVRESRIALRSIRATASTPQSRRFLPGARDILAIAAAKLVDAFGRQLEQTIGERGQKMPVMGDEQHRALELG